MKRQLKVRNEKLSLLDKKIIKMKGEIQIEKEVIIINFYIYPFIFNEFNRMQKN